MTYVILSAGGIVLKLTPKAYVEVVSFPKLDSKT